MSFSLFSAIEQKTERRTGVMQNTDIGKWLKEVVFGESLQNGEKMVEAVRKFFEDSIKLRCLPDVIPACFQKQELPRLAEVLVKALEALDPYRVEVPTLIEGLLERHNFLGRRFAVSLKRHLA